MARMDILDRKILSCLGDDGRISNREIARRLGVSEGTVRQRLRKLSETGGLRIGAQIDIETVPGLFLAFVGVKLDGRHLTECAAQIEELPSVLSTMIVTGRYDLMAVVLADSHQTLVDFVTNRLSHIDGVRDSETFVVLKNYSQWVPVDKLSSILSADGDDGELEFN